MKNKLTKLILIGLSLLLNGCTVKPDATVSNYLTELKTTESINFDSLSIQKYFDSEIELSYNGQVLDYETNESNDVSHRYMELFKGFEYTILKTETNGSQAIVNVEILTYSMGELFSTYLTQLFTKGFEWAFAGLSEEEMTLRSNNLFLQLAENLDKTYTKTVSIYLVKVDDSWVMVGGEKNYALFNALTGGLLDFAKQFSSNMNNS